MEIDVRIPTARFVLRVLSESDATYKYLSWLQFAENQKYVLSASRYKSLEDLRTFIKEKREQGDCLLLGIFTLLDGEHIGNIKFEPINFNEKWACMGILIDQNWQGKRVGSEVLQATGKWLLKEFGITCMVLGVEREHTAAIKLYEKVGFNKVDSSHAKIVQSKPESLVMEWDLTKVEVAQA